MIVKNGAGLRRDFRAEGSPVQGENQRIGRSNESKTEQTHTNSIHETQNLTKMTQFRSQ